MNPLPEQRKTMIRSKSRRYWVALGAVACLMSSTATAHAAIPAAEPTSTQEEPVGEVAPGLQDSYAPRKQAKPGEVSTSGVDGGFFTTEGDYVHISSATTRAASGHGWWIRTSGNATQADVTIQLQRWQNGWYNIGSPVKERVYSGGGSGNRANARYTCKNSTSWNSFRSVVDVDVVGYIDGDSKLYTSSRQLACGI